MKRAEGQAVHPQKQVTCSFSTVTVSDFRAIRGTVCHGGAWTWQFEGDLMYGHLLSETDLGPQTRTYNQSLVNSQTSRIRIPETPRRGLESLSSSQREMLNRAVVMSTGGGL